LLLDPLDLAVARVALLAGSGRETGLAALEEQVAVAVERLLGDAVTPGDLGS